MTNILLHFPRVWWGLSETGANCSYCTQTGKTFPGSPINAIPVLCCFVLFFFFSSPSLFFFSASQTAKWMFEHLCGGLMRTLISYSDLPMLPPSILWQGVTGKGLQKSSLKWPARLHSLGLQVWGLTENPSGRKVHWEDVQIICGVNKNGPVTQCVSGNADSYKDLKENTALISHEK